jgi:aminoglycoside phosphotransferase (APT) family kinase protein
VLDWELASLSDPQLDLAWMLACWVEPGDPADLQSFGLTHLPGHPDRATLLARYARAAARMPEDPVFLYGFGLLRLAVVLQQIYARHRRAGRADARFDRLIALVHDVATLAGRAIRLDRISGLR